MSKSKESKAKTLSEVKVEVKTMKYDRDPSLVSILTTLESKLSEIGDIYEDLGLFILEFEDVIHQIKSKSSTSVISSEIRDLHVMFLKIITRLKADAGIR
jgi:hypothetical protein